MKSKEFFSDVTEFVIRIFSHNAYNFSKTGMAFVAYTTQRAWH
jgi:hypothetical protein